MKCVKMNFVSPLHPKTLKSHDFECTGPTFEPKMKQRCQSLSKWDPRGIPEHPMAAKVAPK